MTRETITTTITDAITRWNIMENFHSRLTHLKIMKAIIKLRRFGIIQSRTTFRIECWRGKSSWVLLYNDTIRYHEQIMKNAIMYRFGISWTTKYTCTMIILWRVKKSCILLATYAVSICIRLDIIEIHSNLSTHHFAVLVHCTMIKINKIIRYSNI